MENKNKKTLYNTVFSLIEEELHQRINPTNYNNNKYDGTNASICGSSNLDISLDASVKNYGNHGLKGGSDVSKNRMSGYVPGKFDVIRNSYHITLDDALKGTIERQKLFLEEMKSSN